MINQPSTQTSHQFFYFYHASILVAEVLGVSMSILQQIKPNIVQTYRWLAVPEFVLGVFGFVLFVCTIIALFVWKKKRYPGFTYWTPAVYLGLTIVMGVMGAVWSVQTMSAAFQNLGDNPSQAEIQAIISSHTIPLWLYLSSYTAAVITTVVTVLVWMNFKRTVDTTNGAPAK